MIVQCPNCGTKYNLPEDKIDPDGSQVRCSNCGQVFEVFPPSAPAAPPAAAPTSPEDDDFADLERELAGDLDDTPANSRASQNVLLDTEGAPTLDDEDPDLSSDSSSGPGGSLGFDLDDEPKKGGGSKKMLLIAALSVLLLVGGGAGLWFSGVLDGLLGDGTQAEQTEDTATTPLTNEEAVRNIELADVRQYYVDNEKAGRILVIEGKAVNRFDTPKDLIKVEGTLFDAQGSALDSRQLLAGNTMSYFQLQILSRTEIEAALNSELGILSNNTNLPTGSSTPLMLVFFEPPADVAEFGLRVIEAKDPPEN